MDPNLLEGGFVLPRELGLELGDSSSEELVDLRVVAPEVLMLCVGQMGQVSLIEGLEIVEEGLHHILIEVVVGEELRHGHEDWVAALLGKKLRNSSFVHIAILFCALQDADPLEVLLLGGHQLQEGAV